jgi:hypothetical protein
MGSTYANVTVVGTTGGDVVAALGEDPAFVADAGDGNVVVFAAADEMDGFSAGITARRLSTALGRPALEVAVFDEDLLTYQVCVDGESVAEGVSPPEIAEAMGEVDVPRPDAAALVAALGRGAVDEARAVLGGSYVFATDRHTRLAEALGLPSWASSHGFEYLDFGDADLPVEAVRTGGDPPPG